MSDNSTSIAYATAPAQLAADVVVEEAAEFAHVVRSRRSVRRFTNDPIPDEVMSQSIDLALLAPNSSNLQPWEFYRIRDQEAKTKIAEFCMGQDAATTAAELIVCVARLDTWRRNRKLMIPRLEVITSAFSREALLYYKRIVPLMYGQGPLYVFGPVRKLLLHMAGLFRPMVRGPASKADMRVWAHKTTALACENLMLSLRAFGYDSCPLEGLDATRVRRFLGLPRAAEICMIIAAGKRAEHGIYGERLRFDRSMFVFEV